MCVCKINKIILGTLGDGPYVWHKSKKKNERMRDEKRVKINEIDGEAQIHTAHWPTRVSHHKIK